jgi:hypothetical protein
MLGGGHFWGGGHRCFALGGAHPCTRVSEGGGDYLLVRGLVFIVKFHMLALDHKCQGLTVDEICCGLKFKSQVGAFYPICSSALVGSLPLRSAIRVFRRGPKHTHMDMDMGTYVYSTGPGRVLKPHNRTSRYVRQFRLLE